MTRRVRTTTLTLAILLLAVPFTRADGVSLDTFSHLRPLDDRAKSLLHEALAHSFTVQQLAGRIERSDVVAYLRVGLLGSDLAGKTTMQASTPQMRYVVVTVDPRAIPVDLISRLGHELRHVVEIVDAPDVRDVDGLRELFKKIGWRSGGSDFWETKDAVAAGREVVREYWDRPTRMGNLVRGNGVEKPAAPR